MARHAAAKHGAPSRWPRRAKIIAPLVVLIVIAGAITAFALGRTQGHPQAAAPPTGPCALGTIRLSVGADPDAVGWLRDLAGRYTAARHEVNHQCITPEVAPLSTADAGLALRTTPVLGSTPPAVWVPESTTALNLVRATPASAAVLPATAPSIATSPMVLATTADATQAIQAAGRGPALAKAVLRAATDPHGWGALGHPDWGVMHLSVPDPETTDAGLATISAAAATVAGVAPPDLSKTMFTSSSVQGGLRALNGVTSTDQDSDALLSAARKATSEDSLRSSLGLLTVPEQDVWRYNAASPKVPLHASYPWDGSLGTDYPFVTTHGQWMDPQTNKAATDFENWLRSAPAQDQLARAGLRHADGSPGALRGTGISKATFAPTPLHGEGAAAAGRTAWALITRRVSVLGLIDVSGSMSEVVQPDGQTKLDLARAAASGSLNLFSSSDQIGLWEFSTALDGSRPYKELVPLGPVDEKIGGVDRRDASATAYKSLKATGGTALYASVLAADDAAKNNYVTHGVNTVVLLTDGRNEDASGGPDLPTLLSDLQQTAHSETPVHVITIAYGKDADTDALAKIAKASGGKSFVAPDPSTIDDVFISALGAVGS